MTAMTYLSKLIIPFIIRNYHNNVYHVMKSIDHFIHCLNQQLCIIYLLRNSNFERGYHTTVEPAGTTRAGTLPAHKLRFTLATSIGCQVRALWFVISIFISLTSSYIKLVYTWFPTVETATCTIFHHEFGITNTVSSICHQRALRIILLFFIYIVIIDAVTIHMFEEIRKWSPGQ